MSRLAASGNLTSKRKPKIMLYVLSFKKKKEFPAATLHASVMTALRVENHIKVGVTFERPIIKIQRTLAYFGYCRYIHINEWLTLCCVNGI